MRERWLFSYVVDHDEGYAPNPIGGICTLVNCKFSHSSRKNIIELAQEGDWIAGTGGKSPLSAGQGRLIYAMRVTRGVPLARYLAAPEFAGRADRFLAGATAVGRYALISNDFYYFGRNAPDISTLPTTHLNHPFEKRGPNYRRDFSEAFIRDFESWLRSSFRPGVHGEPCAGAPSHWQFGSINFVRQRRCGTRAGRCEPPLSCSVKSPGECSTEGLEGFLKLALESGEVSAKGLDRRIQDAYRLGFLYLRSELVGIAALKVPRASYRAKIEANASVELSDAIFPYELGWVYVREVARGRHGSTLLTESLLHEVAEAGIFATSATDKARMHGTLKRHGFVETGMPYSSIEVPGRQLKLFVRRLPT